MENLTLYSMLTALLICILFFIAFELSHPKPEIILPMVVLCTAASIGRLIFAFIPQVQPVTVIVILTGYYLGSSYGFICGSLVAVISNITLGQGPWTPFQMLGWGLIAFIAGLFPKFKNVKLNMLILCIYSFLAAFIFSIITDFLTISYLGNALSIKSALPVFVAGLLFNISHAIGNLIFMFFLFPLLHSKLTRIHNKYEI